MRTDRLSVKILALLLSLLTLLPLASCGVTAPDETEEITAAPTTTEEATTAVSTAEAEEPAKYTVVLNAPASTAIHTPVQASFLSDDDPLSVKDYLRPAYTAQSVNYDDKPGTIELGRPVPITLTWSVETEQTESDIRVFSIRVWPKSAPRKAVTKNLTKSVTSFTLENPMIGTTYCWTVTATDGEGNSYASEVGTFTADAQGPRNLTVGGLTNVRDLGGWNTEDGGRVRQGLLFRGSKLVANNSATNYLVTEEGIKTLRDELKVKTEIDLRLKSKLGGLTASPLGNTVNFYSCPMEDDAAMFFSDANTMKSIRDVFALLADENNYPIYFHCSIGTDRTGVIAWLVNGLCGVREKDLWRDYLFSNFGVINGSRRTGIEGDYVLRMRLTSGDTFAEKIYNYLKNTARVPESDMQAVIRIMKEPAESRP